jgi:carboxymethylenebutenolidase
MTEAVTQLEIDQRVFDLYDEYCHGRIDRREFLRLAALVAGGRAMAQALLPRYAQAQTISFTDTRIKARYVTYPSPGGNSGEMRGYLMQPAGSGPFPAVLVIHENRGLNPYIEDVARRAAVEGFVALAPDGLFPVGGYPGNDDDGRTLQGNLDQAKLRTDMLNSATVLKGQTAGVPHQMHIYPGTQHGFHNNSTPRYHEASAKLAWDRTIAFFKKNLAG